MACSFCGKSQAAVGKLICKPGDIGTRVCICDECIMACTYILEDDTDGTARDPVSIDSQKRHTEADNPLTPLLLRSVERWARLEASGADTAAELRALRSAALRLFAPKTE